MRLATRLAAPALAAALIASALAGCEGASRHAVSGRTSVAAPAAAPAPAPAAPGPRLAFGITEDDADLLWGPASGDPAPQPLQATREELSALRPAYVRVLVDWSKLQPDPARAPELDKPETGCDRGIAPCGAYAGIEAELAAIASQQRAGGGFRVVLDIYGVPAWAAQPLHGCESASTPAYERALEPSALASYRALIVSLLALGAREGVALEWWSPWNEPNDPAFMSPQRVSCSPGSAPASVAVYAQLARTLAATLRAAGGTHRIVLGELAAYTLETPRTLSIARFVSALPAEVLCLAGAFSVHAYASYPPAPTAPDAVSALQAALDARGGCARGVPIWITEAGAGAPRPGRARIASAAEEAAGCEALARQLTAWYANPRVHAVFQYSFREDPDFPVGLASAALTHLYPAYRLWLMYTSVHSGQPLPALESACA